MTEVVQLFFRIIFKCFRIAWALITLIPCIPALYRQMRGAEGPKNDRLDRLRNPHKYLGAE